MDDRLVVVDGRYFVGDLGETSSRRGGRGQPVGDARASPFSVDVMRRS